MSKSYIAISETFIDKKIRTDLEKLRSVGRDLYELTSFRMM